MGSPATVRVNWLPEGRSQTPADFDWRHGVVSLLLAVHLPVLLVVALATTHDLLYAVAVVVLPTVALVVARRGSLSRRVRSTAATAGLLGCSALLVHLSGGSTEMHLHYVVAVMVVALYQDWPQYLLAPAVAALSHGAVPVLDGRSSADLAHGAWAGGLAHVGFVLAECAVLLVFWHAEDKARTAQEQAHRALTKGQASVQARLEESERMRTDLIGTVSHEFRTPLTGIRGTALTLMKRGDRLPDEARRRLLQGVLDQQERLSRLLENMLTASQATATDPTAYAEVDAVAAEVAMLAGRPDARVQVLVQPDTVARIDRQALHQVLANLVHNAQEHGAPGSLPVLTGGSDARGVWVTVANQGAPIDDDARRRLFEPFTQVQNGPTRDREGLGMGLYVVRRLVEVHGGTVTVRSDGGWVTVEVRLAPGVMPPEPRTAPEDDEAWRRLLASPTP